jgi:cell division protein FtsL
MKYFGWLITAAIVLAFYVWQQTQSIRLGYAVDNYRKECEMWEQENKALRLKINRLLSMERLDAVAKEKKLITPDEKKIIYLKEK